MKKFLSAILVMAMLLSMVATAFAEVTSAGTGASTAATMNPITNGTTYVDKETGIAYAEAVEGATVLNVAATQAEYEFTATTGETRYHYSLLDSKTVNGKKQFFILANDIYTAPHSNYITADSSFDPEDTDNNIARFLNEDFYNDTITLEESTVTTNTSGQYNLAYQLLSIDSGMKPYMQNHDWLTEGNSALSNTTMKTDYLANAKVALLSMKEYIMYSDKIGYRAKNRSVMTRNSWYLRSPMPKTDGVMQTNRIGMIEDGSGNISGDASIVSAESGGIKFGIRPCYWVSEDYFKNVRIDVATAGSEVKEEIKYLDFADGLYTADELGELRGSSATLLTAVTPGATYVDKAAGVAYGTEEVAGATMLTMSAAQADYEFTTTTNGVDYHYSILDSKVVDGETQYFIFTNDIYTAPDENYVTVDNTFALAGTGNNIAKFLNNDFYNDTVTLAESTVTTKDGKYNKAYQLYSIDSGIKSYIQDHKWLTEGNTVNSDVMRNDYYTTSKIALLSLKEYIMYSDKIGYQAKNYNKMSRSGWYLRSPMPNGNGVLTNKHIGYVQNTNGTVSGDGSIVAASSGGIKFGIRPCFWVSENYFKNVKIDISTAGSEVIKAIQSLDFADGLYTDEELGTIHGSSATLLKTITPGETYVDKETGVAYAEAVEGAELLAVSATQADYEFTATTNGTSYHYSILDSEVVDGKKQYFIFTNDMYTAPGINYVTADGTFNPNAASNNIAKFLNNDFYNDTISLDESTVTKDSSNKYNGAYQLLSIDSGIKSYIQTHKWMVEGNTVSSDAMKNDYYATCKLALLSLKEYIMYSDKIGYQAKNYKQMSKSNWYLRSPMPNGNGVLTKNHIGQVGNTTGIAASDASIINSSEGQGIKFGIRPCFWVSEDYFKNVKIDVLSAGSGVINEIKSLDFADGLYTEMELNLIRGIFSVTPEITTEAFAKGETATAKIIATTSGNTDDMIIEFIFASYNGDNLVDVAVKRVVVNANNNETIEETLDLTLTDNVTQLKAFVWDEDMVPYALNAEAMPE